MFAPAFGRERDDRDRPVADICSKATIVAMVGGRLPKWIVAARRRQRVRALKLNALLLGLTVCWICAACLGFWAWVELFHRLPTQGTMKATIFGLGEAVMVAYFRFGHLYPFKGRSPEEAAAAAFLSKKDVRSDDHTFEDELRG